VEFMEGDPDRPLVTGTVYGSATNAPQDATASDGIERLKKGDVTTGAAVGAEKVPVQNSHRNLLRDRGTELSMVDDGAACVARLRSRKSGGADLILDGDYLHQISEKSYQQVGDCFRQHVANDVERSVGGNVTEVIDGAVSKKIKGDYSEVVSGAVTSVAKKDESWLKLGGSEKGRVGGEFKLNIGGYCDIFLGFKLSVKVGAFVSINLAPITVKYNFGINLQWNLASGVKLYEPMTMNTTICLGISVSAKMATLGFSLFKLDMCGIKIATAELEMKDKKLVADKCVAKVMGL